MSELSSRSIGIVRKSFQGISSTRILWTSRRWGVDMVEASTEEGKPFRVFCFKEPDYVMKIMASWMNLDELEGSNTESN